MFSSISATTEELTQTRSKFGYRALPRLNLLRLFAFVKQDVFLQEPVSTCFSFLLDWRDSSNSDVLESIKLGPS